MRELTERQREVLEFIKERVRRKGYPPSVREIREAVGLRSSSTVHGHLRRLESKGYIRRDPTKPRAIEIIDDEPPAEIPITMKELVSVPIVGSVTAGQPILDVENIEDYVPLPRDFASDGTTFMLRVKGDSMIQVGILDGDYVIVRQQPDATNGDIVVALLEDEATVKRFYREADHIRLQPENPLYEPIITTDVQILGKVIGVLRRIH